MNEPAKKRTGPIQFAREVRQEARKVTWTTWRETAITTVMVFIMVGLAAAFFLLVDLALKTAVTFGLSLGA